ncbi:hypothetical protein T05_5743 [Trichinella murrelli]|uniref:CCHC-type domain-containing protein n=1 Tax=Trichinella murrelli TaxID=144512 RepID=A0A0V0T6V3_9BILA|nr:hypothetical protein T05_5743 [Trichinella murrelli]
MRHPGKKKIIPFDKERKSLEHRIQRLQRLCDNEADLEDSEKAKALADYDQLLDLVTQLQSSERSAKTPASSRTCHTTPQRNIKAFWGQFDGAVHRRKDFDNVTKFVHLKSCLSSEALQLTIGLTVTAENYGELVKLLHDRFHRTTDILDAHINRLHELQSASSHSRKGLLLLHDEINSQLLEIRAVGRDIDTRHGSSGFRMLLPRLANLPPSLTRTKWKEHSTKLTEEGLTSKAFLSFLSQHALCDHHLPNCKRFLSQGLEERKKTARTLHLCFKCLQHGHRATECKLKDKQIQTTRKPTQKKSRLEDKTEASANVLTSSHGPTRIRFQTIRAITHGAEGKRMIVSCLFDSAAERTLREDVAQTLGLAGPIETIIILRGGHDDPVAIETTPGWVVFGPVNPSPNPTSQVNCVQVENEIEQTLKKFWELDSIGIKPQDENPSQDSVSAKFHSNLAHDGSRYTVGLLWKPGEIRLSNNRSLAEQRLQAIERSIMKDPAKELAYSTGIEEYIRNGWAEEVTSQHVQNGKTWYLPHHAVYKTVNGELKCRIVFDGSAIYGGVSLNQCLETGPNLQTDLVGVLLRLRQYQIAVQANIEKMYLQVALRVEDRDACVSCGATAYRTLRCECIALPVCVSV